MKSANYFCSNPAHRQTDLITSALTDVETDWLKMGSKEWWWYMFCRLPTFADRLIDRFVASGIMLREYDHVKLHITIMNSLMRKDPSHTIVSQNDRAYTRSSMKSRESFDAMRLMQVVIVVFVEIRLKNWQSQHDPVHIIVPTSAKVPAALGIHGYNSSVTAHHLASEPNGPGLVVMVILGCLTDLSCLCNLMMMLMITYFSFMVICTTVVHVCVKKSTS